MYLFSTLPECSGGLTADSQVAYLLKHRVYELYRQPLSPCHTATPSPCYMWRCQKPGQGER